MSGQRASWDAVERRAVALSDRDWQIVRSLASCRVLSGDQLSRLHFADLSPLTQHRTRRRVLQRLTDWHVLTRLDRQIGGVRAGSTGWIFTLGPIGQRLIQLDAVQRPVGRTRTPWTPSLLFLKHSLAVAEVYVQLVERSKVGSFQLASFAAEPACWWPDGLGGWLKPDAFLRLRTAGYDELVWLEVDRGTESLPTLRRKLAGYLDFVQRGQLGPDGVLPHVVIAVPGQQRAESVAMISATLQASPGIFTVDTAQHIADRIAALTVDTTFQPP
jgi:hypothetical protein